MYTTRVLHMEGLSRSKHIEANLTNKQVFSMIQVT